MERDSMRKIYNKLVRDRIPAIIQSECRDCQTRRLTSVEYQTELKAKLVEEARERFFRRLNPSSPSAEINKNGFSAVVFKMVGMTGFEPATPSSRTKCTTKLCYIPIPFILYANFKFLQDFFLGSGKKFVFCRF